MISPYAINIPDERLAMIRAKVRLMTGASCLMREVGRLGSGSMTSSGLPLIGGTATTGVRSNGGSTHSPTSRPTWKASASTSFM